MPLVKNSKESWCLKSQIISFTYRNDHALRLLILERFSLPFLQSFFDYAVPSRMPAYP